MCAQVRVDDECIYWNCYVVWWLWGSKISVLKKDTKKVLKNCLLDLSLCGSGTTLSNTYTHHGATFIKHTHHGVTFRKHTHTHTMEWHLENTCAHTHTHTIWNDTYQNTYTHTNTCTKSHNFFCRERVCPTNQCYFEFYSFQHETIHSNQKYDTNQMVVSHIFLVQLPACKLVCFMKWNPIMMWTVYSGLMKHFEMSCSESTAAE